MDDFSNHLRGGYRKRAFSVQYNLILLFGAVAFALASASWVPVAVGGALELLWLVCAPWFAGFRHWVDTHEEGSDIVSSNEPSSRDTAPPLLDGEYAERMRRLTGSIREIRNLAGDELRRVPNDELYAMLTALPDVTHAFERLCGLHQRLSRFVQTTPKAELERELARLSESFSQERDLGLRVTLRQAVVLAQRRLDQFTRIGSLHRASEIRLDMIESSAAHVRSRGLTMASATEFAVEIQGLLTHVASVSALEHDSIDQPASSRSSLGPAAAVAGDR